MNKVYQVYQVSDSTGETLDRIFLAIKAQFSNFDCKTIHYSFTRTKNQIDKIISKSKEEKNITALSVYWLFLFIVWVVFFAIMFVYNDAVIAWCISLVS